LARRNCPSMLSWHVKKSEKGLRTKREREASISAIKSAHQFESNKLEKTGRGREGSGRFGGKEAQTESC